MPKACPKGNWTPIIRDSRNRSAMNGTIVTVTVGMPVSSSSRASTGTCLQQAGQAGARTNALTPDCFNRLATSGICVVRQSASLES